MQRRERRARGRAQIYRDGVSGRRPPIPLDADRLEAAARRRMAPHAFNYVAAGAGNEHTVAANRAAFHRWRIVPRMLRDVEHRDTSVELFGQRLPSPFLLAPVGVLELAHPEADCAVARAARDTGTAMVFSNQASKPMEGVARILGDSPTGSSSTGADRTSSSRVWSRGRSGAAAGRLRSRSTRPCSGGARATSRARTYRSSTARASRSTRATRCSSGSSPRRQRRIPSSRSHGRPRRASHPDRAHPRLPG